MRKNSHYGLIILCWFSCGLNVSSLNINAPYVSTPLGKINGYFKKSAEGRQYAAFEGIPYALPPVGELRFKPPVPIFTWTKDINALKLPKACIQYNPLTLINKVNKRLLGIEDCLYLNIYTPTTNGTLPVIFWIHGGGFQYGTSSSCGAKFLIDKNLILVTINYRVGPFGFLSTGDDVVSGNMGLKDQSLALRWVSENIKYFGGDPKRITLAGVSAGGASVHYHYLSPMSAGLFQNGIAFSGTALNSWAHNHDSTETTKTLANALKCPVDDSLKMIQCLRVIPANNITTTIQELLSEFYFSYVLFPPVTEKINENYFINDSPKNVIEKGQAYDVPWITGIVSEEGLFVTAGFGLNKTMITHTDKNWETIAPYMLHYINILPVREHSKVAKLAKEHYFGNESFSTNRNFVKNLTHLIGDEMIAIGAIKAAKLQAKVNKSPVWFYHYSYRAAQSFSDHLANTSENLGVSHADDILLVLENKYIDPTTTPEDRKMLQDMLNFWNSVASTSKPNLGTHWVNLNESPEVFPYMHIAGPGNFTMKHNKNLGELLFWEELGL